MRRTMLIAGLASLLALTLIGSQVAAAQLTGPTPTICVGSVGAVMNPTTRGGCLPGRTPVTIANQPEVASLATQQQADMTAIAALQSQQQADAAAIKALQGQQSTDVTAIAALQKQQAADMTAIAALQQQQAADMTSISNLRTQQTTDVANISTLQSDVSALQSAPKPAIGVVQDSGSISGDSSTGAAVGCPSGAVAISGGVRWVGGGDFGSSSMRMLESYPTNGGTAWFTNVFNNGGSGMTVSFYAVCLSGAAYNGGA